MGSSKAAVACFYASGTHKHTNAHPCTHIHTRIHTTLTHTHTHTYTHIHAYTHIHTYIRKHIQTLHTYLKHAIVVLQGGVCYGAKLVCVAELVNES